ncbi:hypothetical protein ACTXT7_005370 [Hymenolepis weldensis]
MLMVGSSTLKFWIHFTWPNLWEGKRSGELDKDFYPLTDSGDRARTQWIQNLCAHIWNMQIDVDLKRRTLKSGRKRDFRRCLGPNSTHQRVDLSIAQHKSPAQVEPDRTINNKDPISQLSRSHSNPKPTSETAQIRGMNTMTW